MARFPKNVTYANVMSTMALFVALGGVSYAAVELPKDSVGTKQLKSDAVTPRTIRDEAVSTRAIRDGGVGIEDLNSTVFQRLASEIPAGPTGPAGADGKDGARGPAGADGRDGSTGPTGLRGPTGADGLRGPAGADGKDGLRGPTGADGKDGQRGPTGADGNDGLRGPTGADGTAGIQGPTGPTGTRGPTGPSGGGGGGGGNFASFAADVVQPALTLGFSFIGGTSTISTLGGTLYGSAEATLYFNRPASGSIDPDLCYQQQGGSVTRFQAPGAQGTRTYFNNSQYVSFSTVNTARALSAGTYTVGLCVRGLDMTPLNEVNTRGWIMEIPDPLG